MQELSPTLALFAAAFVIALSGALMPGPLLTVTISEAISKGHRAGPLTVFGHGLAELALVSAVAAGFGPLLRPAPVVAGIGLVGGLVLLWMAVTMARGSAAAAQQAIGALHAGGETSPQAGHPGGAWRCVLLGAVTSVTNPYWILWWVTIGLSLLTQALQIGPFAVAAFYLGHILADLLWYWAVAFTVSRGSSWLSIKAYRGVLLACAAFLLVMGVRFGAGGFLTLVRR